MKSSTRKPAKSFGQTSRIPQRFFCDFLQNQRNAAYLRKIVVR